MLYDRCYVVQPRQTRLPLPSEVSQPRAPRRHGRASGHGCDHAPRDRAPISWNKMTQTGTGSEPGGSVGLGEVTRRVEEG